MIIKYCNNVITSKSEEVEKRSQKWRANIRMAHITIVRSMVEGGKERWRERDREEE